MSDKQRLNEINQQQSVSTWFITLSVKEEGCTINKNCFWDQLQLRYGWHLQQFPITCEYGARFTMEHALPCRKGGFISLRDNQTQDLTANLLKVCHDVLIEPTLQHLFSESAANSTDKAHIDILARGFCISGQQSFFDIRLFHPMVRRYISQELTKAYKTNKHEKKRKYTEQILEVEHGSFTSFVMTTSAGKTAID